jgi:hypothetical protein
MTMWVKVRMSFLVSTISICQRKELNVVEGSACNCFRPIWKPTSHTMVAKVLWIVSWVPMHSLPWAQPKRWIPIRLMGCVHTHWGMHAIEGWGSPSHIWSVVQKTRENNRKAVKIDRIINQSPTFGREHDKIRAWWASYVLWGSMLEHVWWCKCFEMESWSWSICCSMNCSNGRIHAHAKDGRRSHATFKCCYQSVLRF